MCHTMRSHIKMTIGGQHMGRCEGKQKWKAFPESSSPNSHPTAECDMPRHAMQSFPITNTHSPFPESSSRNPHPLHAPTPCHNSISLFSDSLPSLSAFHFCFPSHRTMCCPPIVILMWLSASKGIEKRERERERERERVGEGEREREG